MTDSSTVFFLMMPHPPTSTPFPSPTLFRSYDGNEEVIERWYKADEPHLDPDAPLIREDFDRNDPFAAKYPRRISDHQISRSEEHTSELQSRQYLVCRLLLEKNKNLLER